jgi:hypothetical protein
MIVGQLQDLSVPVLVSKLLEVAPVQSAEL